MLYRRAVGSLDRNIKMHPWAVSNVGCVCSKPLLSGSLQAWMMLVAYVRIHVQLSSPMMPCTTSCTALHTRKHLLTHIVLLATASLRSPNKHIPPKQLVSRKHPLTHLVLLAGRQKSVHVSLTAASSVSSDGGLPITRRLTKTVRAQGYMWCA